MSLSTPIQIHLHSGVDQLRASLQSLSLDPRGNKKKLLKRLHKATRPLPPAPLPPKSRPAEHDFDCELPSLLRAHEFRLFFFAQPLDFAPPPYRSSSFTY